ncbi:hypothetical protein YSA_00702 [Pseudomonas putida ND6]|uniref:Uncharacterized protein n=1 Tax=Pseudomonas putida ND6 TaxID=231023 RepID=I3UNT6_PSEPU|nr:hypothetical protein YSA_00702 [Pseudomonas putida ND6]
MTGTSLLSGGKRNPPPHYLEHMMGGDSMVSDGYSFLVENYHSTVS